MIARLTSWLRRRYEARQHRDRERVAAVLRRHPDLSGGEVARLAYLNIGRAYVALAAMEYDGRIAGRWVGGPHPRRRVYRLVVEYCPTCIERCEGQHAPCDVDGRCREDARQKGRSTRA